MKRIRDVDRDESENRFLSGFKTNVQSRKKKKINAVCKITQTQLLQEFKIYNLYETFEIVEKINEGAYGKVYKAINKLDNNIYALKYNKNPERIKELIMREVKFLQKLDHKNIVKLYGIAYEGELDSNFYMIFEYMDYDLRTFAFKYEKSLTLSHIKNILKQILCGLDHLHRQKILHLDIKPANILINKKGEVKLADFGMSNLCMGGKYPKNSITQNYRPPELFLTPNESIEYKYEVDIWSYGCVALELLLLKDRDRHANQMMFYGSNDLDILNCIFSVCGSPVKDKVWDDAFSINRNYVLKYENIPKKSQIDHILGLFYKDCTKVTSFVQDLLKIDPKQRKSANVMLYHEFFQADPDMSTTDDIRNIILDVDLSESKELISYDDI